MLRKGAARLALWTTPAPAARPTASFSRTFPSIERRIQSSSMASKRPQVVPWKPCHPAMLRRYITPEIAKEHKEAEKKYAQQSIKPTPETVSSTSSTHPLFSEIGTETPTREVDMMADIKHDVGAVKATFNLRDVPQEAYYMGLAGTLPYLATSFTTVYLAWELKHTTAGFGYLVSEANATYLLHLLEPIQIGYGASILSFLGAIHWGLEWAGYGGYQGYKRYAIGVAAPLVAASTLLMPIEGALITQFIGFVALYYVDTRAATRGWTPPWYAVYRFVLTFIVGASLVLCLIGRGELPDHVPGAEDRAKVFKSDGESTERLAKEEKARIEKKKKAAHSDDRGS